MLPGFATGETVWVERHVRELKRLPDKEHAASVAQTILDEVKKEDGPKLTAATVRRFVDDELGIDRSGPAAASQGRSREIDLPEWLGSHTGTLEKMQAVLTQVPCEAWETLTKFAPTILRDFMKISGSLNKTLRTIRDGIKATGPSVVANPIPKDAKLTWAHRPSPSDGPSQNGDAKGGGKTKT